MPSRIVIRTRVTDRIDTQLHEDAGVIGLGRPHADSGRDVRKNEYQRALSREGITARSFIPTTVRWWRAEQFVRRLPFYNTCGDIDILIAALKRIASGRP